MTTQRMRANALASLHFVYDEFLTVDVVVDPIHCRAREHVSSIVLQRTVL